MAWSFGSPQEEAEMVRGAAGLIDLSCHGAIKVAGKEAIQFLNGLVTNDVKTLEKGKGMSAAFLTGHGKVRALCRVLNLGEEFLILTDPQTHEKVYKYIFPFSYAGDFKVEDVSETYRMLSVQGPKSLLVMKETSFEPVPQLGENDWIQTIMGGHEVLVVRHSLISEAGFDILVSSDGLNDVWDFLLLKGGYHSLAPFGVGALDILMIEAGIPVYGIDLDESNMMLETGLSAAVSFTKGCYTGQEAVAMATYRGHVSKRLSGLIIESPKPPASGEKVLQGGKEIGRITNSLSSKRVGAIIALAYVKYGFFDAGTTVEVEVEGKAFPARVVELPFIK
jgi:aminomethyltransferase